MNTNRIKEEQRYICFFQSVLTVGIMSRGKDAKDAENKAESMLKNSSGVNYCAFDQSPFEVTEVREWSPEFEPDLSSDEFAFKFHPDEKTQNIIATRLGKTAEELTDADLEEFVKSSIEAALIQTEAAKLDEK